MFLKSEIKHDWLWLLRQEIFRYAINTESLSEEMMVIFSMLVIFSIVLVLFFIYLQQEAQISAKVAYLRTFMKQIIHHGGNVMAFKIVIRP